MIKFRRRNPEVDAEQFDPNKFPLPDGIKLGATISGGLDAGRYPIYWLTNGDDFIKVLPGDWIITDDLGIKSVAGPEAFQIMYEPIIDVGL